MRRERIFPKAAALVIAAASIIGPAGAVSAHTGPHDDSPNPGEHGGAISDWTSRTMKPVQRATAAYHSLNRALGDGYEAFAIPPEVGGTPTAGQGIPGDPTCFDSRNGGMGVHYVKGLDADLDAEHPEALVYEVGQTGHLDLVAVEYIVPIEFVDPDNPPSLFGHQLHQHPYLPVYILHAWVWKTNPDGMFADYNPEVGSCTAVTRPPRHSNLVRRS